MKKDVMQFNLSVMFLREKKRVVAYAPALDLSTSGKTLNEAKKRFTEIARLFFEEIMKKGTTSNVLTDLGWHRVKRDWKAPTVISQEAETFRVPVHV